MNTSHYCSKSRLEEQLPQAFVFLLYLGVEAHSLTIGNSIKKKKTPVLNMLK